MKKLLLGFILIIAFSMLHAQQNAGNAPIVQTASGKVQVLQKAMSVASKESRLPPRRLEHIVGGHRNPCTHGRECGRQPNLVPILRRWAFPVGKIRSPKLRQKIACTLIFGNLPELKRGQNFR